jgi:hypothetical protein
MKDHAYHYFNCGFYARVDNFLKLRFRSDIPIDNYIMVSGGRNDQEELIHVPCRDFNAVSELITAPGLADMTHIKILKAFYGVDE